MRPLLKKPNLPLLDNNFRPVSNLVLLSKLIEMAVDEQLGIHVFSTKKFEPLQSAYQAGHSTETALLKIKTDILNNIENRKVTVLLLLDLSAAFDVISHSKLINRLKVRYGITGKALSWFSSYLENRSQQVVVGDYRADGAISDKLYLNQGVPQGSILGSKIFCLWVTFVESTSFHTTCMQMISKIMLLLILMTFQIKHFKLKTYQRALVMFKHGCW